MVTKAAIYVVLLLFLAFLALVFLPISFEQEAQSGIDYSDRYYQLKEKSFLTEEERREIQREVEDYEHRTRKYWESKGFKVKEDK